MPSSNSSEGKMSPRSLKVGSDGGDGGGSDGGGSDGGGSDGGGSEACETAVVAMTDSGVVEAVAVMAAAGDGNTAGGVHLSCFALTGPPSDVSESRDDFRPHALLTAFCSSPLRVQSTLNLMGR